MKHNHHSARATSGSFRAIMVWRLVVFLLVTSLTLDSAMQIFWGRRILGALSVKTFSNSSSSNTPQPCAAAVETTTTTTTTAAEPQPQANAESADHANMEIKATRITNENMLQVLGKNIVKDECGKLKCFYRSKENPLVGYLVASSRLCYAKLQYTVCDSSFEKQYKAWEMADYLARVYGAKHLFLEAPYIINVTSVTLQGLGPQMVDRTIAHLDSPIQHGGEVSLTIQPVRKAPRYKIFRCHHDAARLQRVNSKFANNLVAYASRISEETSRLRAMLQNDDLCARDFQLMVDADGNFWWHDLDRCLHEEVWEERKKKRQCFAWIERVQKVAWASVTNPKLTNATNGFQGDNHWREYGAWGGSSRNKRGRKAGT